MSAINFLNTQKVEYKIPSLKKHKITEQHALNHHIITLYTMEIVDELSLLASEGIISDKDIKFFEKKSNLDVDYMEMLYSTFCIFKKLIADIFVFYFFPVNWLVN